MYCMLLCILQYSDALHKKIFKQALAYALSMTKCDQCGTCCRLFAINLTEDEYKSGRYKTQFDFFPPVDDFVEAELTGANILQQKEDGSCIYLKDNKCSIHDDRPRSCREFFCDSKEDRFSSMIEKIRDKKGEQKKI